MTLDQPPRESAETLRQHRLARRRLLRRLARAGSDRDDGDEADGPRARRRRPRGRRIGLLGGSFNPAHAAHLDISLVALKRLGLDEVWWLVSPQNPLKPADGMAPFALRLAGARQLARHRRIRVSGVEAALGTTYTAETLKRLMRRWPGRRFVWLMGADNLAQLPAWRDWPQIFNTLPVAVLARPTYCLRALAGKAAQRFAAARLKEAASRTLAGLRPPAWVFVHGRLNPLSATQIRAARAKRTRRDGEKGSAAAEGRRKRSATTEG